MYYGSQSTTKSARTKKILTGITCLKTSFCFVSPVEEDAAGSKSGIFILFSDPSARLQYQPKIWSERYDGMGKSLKGFRRYVTTSGRWSLRPTAVSAARVTSSVRVRYVRPMIFTPGIIHIHGIFTA